MSQMEDDAKDFLVKIVKTLMLGLLWLFINVTMGIYNNWLFFHTKPTTGNYIFYAWLLISLCSLLAYYYKLWKSSFKDNN